MKQQKNWNFLEKRIKLKITTVGGNTKTTDSYSYKIFLHDKENIEAPIEVLGIENKSTDICEAQIENLNQTFNKIPLTEIDQPKHGKIDYLIGFQCSAFHPVSEQAVGHLLLLKNEFRYVTGGSRAQLKDVAKKQVKSKRVHHLSHKI